MRMKAIVMLMRMKAIVILITAGLTNTGQSNLIYYSLSPLIFF